MTTEKTDTKTDLGPELTTIAGQRHPLAIVGAPPAGTPGYAPFKAPAMTNERKEFLKRQFTPTGCTDLEFEFFLAYCERTGLDPVIKQAYLVERKQKVFKNGADVWVSKFEPMSAEAGMAARADAMPDFEGIDDGVVYEGDTFTIDYAAGTVVHTANPLKRGRIIGAWAHVHRKGRRVPITWLRVEERIQTKGDGSANLFWSKMTATQILKCARAEQWRQAYPNLFAGEFVPEEMNRDEVDVTPPNAHEEARPTADRLADKIKPTAQAQATQAPSSTPAKPPAPGGVTIDVQRPEPKPEQAKAPGVAAPPKDPAHRDHQTTQEGGTAKADAAAAASNVLQMPKPGEKGDPSKVTVFGPELAPIGTEIAKLEGPVLLQMIALGESKVGSIKNAARKAEVRTSIDSLSAERKRREDALMAESEASSAAAQAKPDEKPPREPGSDDGEEF